MPEFYALFNNIDITDKQTVNDMVFKFSCFIDTAAKPLLQVLYLNNSRSFTCTSEIRSAEWFDNDCVRKRKDY